MDLLLYAIVFQVSLLGTRMAGRAQTASGAALVFAKDLPCSSIIHPLELVILNSYNDSNVLATT